MPIINDWDHKKVGKQLSIIRLQWLVMFQPDLATALGCSKDHVSRVERGIAEYTLSQIKALEHLTGFSIDEMLAIENPAKIAWFAQYLALSAEKRDLFGQCARDILKFQQ
jgi:transcriptional regulator with XRE-family HTH domain